MKRSKVTPSEKANVSRGGSIVINNLHLTNGIHVAIVSDIGLFEVNNAVVNGIHDAFVLENIDNVRISNYLEKNRRGA